MTWKDFIAPIHESGISGDASYKILLGLFKRAGSIDDVPEVTIKSWLSGNRNCKVSTYFPTGKIDTKNLFRYFRNRPDSKLKQLQQIFRAGKNTDYDSPINVETADLDTFCWSLVNQFLDLLKFERIDIPQSKGDTIHERNDLFPHNHKCCLYCTHWNGNKSIVGISKIPIDGTCCTHHGNKVRFQKLLSSTAACANYTADETLLSRMKEVGYDVKDLYDL